MKAFLPFPAGILSLRGLPRGAQEDPGQKLMLTPLIRD